MALSYQHNQRDLSRRALRRETRRSCERWSPLQSKLFVIATSTVLWSAILFGLITSL